MEVGKFVIAYLRNNRRQIKKSSTIDESSIVKYSSRWGLRHALAVATATVDYGCKFNAQGLCKNRLPYFKNKTKVALDEMANGKYNHHPTMCCCAGCYSAMGYLNEIPNDLDTITNIAECYEEKDFMGFWRKDKGCVLPRRYRSDTCLGHHCYAMDRKDRFLLMLLDSHRSSKSIVNLRKETYRLLSMRFLDLNDPYSIRQIINKVFDDTVKPDKKLMKELDLNRKRLR